MGLHYVLKDVLTFKRQLYVYACVFVHILYTHPHLSISTVSQSTIYMNGSILFNCSKPSHIAQFFLQELIATILVFHSFLVI